MTTFYVRAADFMRQRKFEVLAPAYYHPYVSSESLIPQKKELEPINPHRLVPRTFLDPTPFRMDYDPDEEQRCLYTVQIMLDMFKKNVPFQILHDHDVVEIFDNLDRYLLTLENDVSQGIEESIEYARLVVKWRAEVYKHYFRFMKTNPVAMDELYPKNNSQDNIFTLMANVGGADKHLFSTDPLRARAQPPYDIDKTLPGAVPSTSDSGVMDDVFGLSINTMADKPKPSDNPFDGFSLDAFMSKKG